MKPSTEPQSIDPNTGAVFCFDWKKARWLSFRLVLLVAISVLVHAFCFYLFQVVYPPAERFSQTPARIMFLSANDSASREMLREIEDRVVYFNSASRESVKEEGIEDFGVAFRPSFAENGTDLKLMPRAEPVPSVPEPVEYSKPVLPVAKMQFGREADKMGRVEFDGMPKAAVGGAIGDRAILTEGDWGWTAERRGQMEGHKVVLRVGVTPEGRMQHLFVDRGIEGPIDVKIVSSARSILLEARKGGEIEWGTLSLQW